MPPGSSRPLPPGYEELEELSHRDGVLVLKARHGGEVVVLRIEEKGDAAESQAELSVLAAVDHPGIAGLVDHGRLSDDRGGRFLARRFVEGQDLLAWSAGRPPEDIGRAVARVCAPLDHLHRLGFVHADLKPENVIVDDQDRAFLCDFGLSRASGTGPSEGVSGTLFAIAPEVLLGDAATPQADLFALGAMLHRLFCGQRTTAREFYSLFPRRSFLDAAGSGPEDLPEWARDLVVSLTNREPGRRPRSAMAVGRTLAERLGMESPAHDGPDELRWPVGLGRETWSTRWLAETAEAGIEPQWIRVVEGEDPRAFWEHLRLFASLRGRPGIGLDVDASLANVRKGTELEAWAAGLAEGEGTLIALAATRDAWSRRGIELLARTCVLGGPERSRQLVVLAEGEPPSGIDWNELQVPAVDEPIVRRFLTTHFRDEEPARLDELTSRLTAAGGGSATTLDAILGQCLRDGRILHDDDGYRLRPGPLPELALEAGGADRWSTLSPEARTLLRAADVCRQRIGADELRSLADLDEGTFGAALVELSSQRLLRTQRGESGLEVLPPSVRAPADPEAARALHARRAAQLAGGDDPAAYVHAFCAAPNEEHLAALTDALLQLRNAGKAEIAVEVVERIDDALARQDLALVDISPEVVIEHAHSWCALLQPDHAARQLERLADVDAPRTHALIELARARIAGLRKETDLALASCARAVELDPSAAIEAECERIELLHGMGRDREVVDAVGELAPRELVVRGRLANRRRVSLESMASMSSFRLGDVEAARAATDELIADARRAQDASLEGPLRINLATIERRAGSLTRAREELRAAIELFDRAGLVSGMAHARANLGGLLRDFGEFTQAEPLLLSALETRERLGEADAANTVRGMLGLLYFDRGHALAGLGTLTASAGALTGGQRRRHAPFLLAKADEIRARLGRPAAEDASAEGEEADPRILLAKARSAWLRGEATSAGKYARRARGLAESLKLKRAADEATLLGELLQEDFSSTGEPWGESLLDEDRRILHQLARTGAEFDVEEARQLALSLTQRGRDDRAARMWYALAARAATQEEAIDPSKRAEECLDVCAEGLTDAERETFKRALLGIPDPWPGDFTLRPEGGEEEDFEMDVVSLLDINKQLVQQQDFETLIGFIVEKGLEVTGAERGFLVLEENGQLRFDMALDSCRGDIAQPEFEISGSVVLEALRRMEPIRVSNAVDDPLLGHTQSVVSLELRSVLCIPIEIEPGLRAALYLDHRLRTGAFDDRSERLCILLANQAALAIQQVRRLGEIRDLNKALERRVIQQESDLRNARAALRDAGLAGPVGGIVGESPSIRAVHELIGRVAPSDIPVLVTGPSGSGKELAARSLHERSNRSSGPYVSENCAALPPTLIESELFGYRRGAFTGAESDREGVFERAHGGTLFLDEIGEMPVELQAKLLRVLELSEVRRLGDPEPRKVDFRLVVATNRDLEEEVREGRFREDLFFRLDGLRIDMPALEERPEDIPLLVEHFLELERQKTGITRKISKSVMTKLCRRAWPGNVRELRNEVSRLCVLSEGDLGDANLVREAGSTVKESTGLLAPLADLERKAILHALDHTKGDKRQAAEILGISRAKIYQRLKEWGLT